jgi:thiamine-phosphate diphosphorylase
MRACLVEQVRYAIDAGIDVVQVRERDLESAALADLVAELVALAAATPGSTTRIVVNDRLDVALAAGAAGVHLRGDSMSPSAIRSIVPPRFAIGCSVHSPAEAAAIGTAADYLVAGAVWASHSKPAGQRVLGTDGLAAVVAAASVPVLAIGGVTVDRVAEAAAAGADGIAAIGLFMSERSAVSDVSHRAPPALAVDGPPACRAVPLSAVTRSARAKFGVT